MGVIYNQDFGKAKTAKDLLTEYPLTLNKNGYYFLYPNGRNQQGQLVYCDMTIDGGGWMLIARSHPTGTPTSWGWLGNKDSDVKSFTAPYQAGWGQYWKDSASFTSFLFGNRSNVNNNSWGPFVYKWSNITYSTFMNSDTLQTYTGTVIQTNTSVFNSTAFPGMQGVTGFATTGTTNKNYFLRDCCGYAGYGGNPNAMVTTYINDPTNWAYSGPWGAGSSTDGSGNFTQTTGSTNYGGTNQYMIYVK
jgi:hypothetical protein